MKISNLQKKFHNFSMRRKTSVILVCDDPKCAIEIKGSKISEAHFANDSVKGRAFQRNNEFIRLR